MFTKDNETVSYGSWVQMDEYFTQGLPLQEATQQVLMRAAIAAGAASRHLATEREGVFHLTPSEWSQLEASAAKAD